MGLIDLSALSIDDEDDFRHVGLYTDLRKIALAAGKRALVLSPESAQSWDRASFLNHVFWDDETADVLCEAAMPADVLMHIAWHHLAHRGLRPSPEAGLLGESIASAFDLYLVGRLLGHRPESSFLESQVPRMLEAALAAGRTEAEFEQLLAFMSEQPEAAFEELRQLLFDASTSLSAPMSPEAAAKLLSGFDQHRFGCLLHHYELTTWVLRARIERLEAARGPAPEPAGESAIDALELDRRLRASSDSIELLERLWIGPTLAGS